MNTKLPSACVCYGLYDNDSIVGFCGVLHQPHGRNKKIKRVSRLVILPDYQGIGLGTRFLDIVADYYNGLGFDFTIVTSAKNMISALNKSSKWIMTRYNVENCASNKSAIDYKRSSLRKVKTGGFKYVESNVEKTN